MLNFTVVIRPRLVRKATQKSSPNPLNQTPHIPSIRNLQHLKTIYLPIHHFIMTSSYITKSLLPKIRPHNRALRLQPHSRINSPPGNRNIRFYTEINQLVLLAIKIKQEKYYTYRAWPHFSSKTPHNSLDFSTQSHTPPYPLYQTSLAPPLYAHPLS